jgi:hypothetical protein
MLIKNGDYTCAIARSRDKRSYGLYVVHDPTGNCADGRTGHLGLGEVYRACQSIATHLHGKGLHGELAERLARNFMDLQTSGRGIIEDEDAWHDKGGWETMKEDAKRYAQTPWSTVDPQRVNITIKLTYDRVTRVRNMAFGLVIWRGTGEDPVTPVMADVKVSDVLLKQIQDDTKGTVLREICAAVTNPIKASSALRTAIFLKLADVLAHEGWRPAQPGIPAAITQPPKPEKPAIFAVSDDERRKALAALGLGLQ